jgi:hypothetical protein
VLARTGASGMRRREGGREWKQSTLSRSPSPAAKRLQMALHSSHVLPGPPTRLPPRLSPRRIPLGRPPWRGWLGGHHTRPTWGSFHARRPPKPRNKEKKKSKKDKRPHFKTHNVLPLATAKRPAQPQRQLLGLDVPVRVDVFDAGLGPALLAHDAGPRVCRRQG